MPLLLLFLAISAAPAAAQLTEWSRDLCVAAPPCAARWFPAGPTLVANASFDYVFAWRVAPRLGLVWTPLMALCAANATEDPLACLYYEQLYIQIMSSVLPCPRPNEQFIYGQNCTCPEGADCSDQHNGNFLFGMNGLAIFVGACLFVGFINLHWGTQRSLGLDTKVRGLVEFVRTLAQ
jgi:hypothetical protein